MSRIPGVPTTKASLFTKIAYWFSKRRVGKIMEPLAVTAHHPTILRGYGAYEFYLDRARLVDARLKALASLKAAALIGCPF